MRTEPHVFKAPGKLERGGSPDRLAMGIAIERAFHGPACQPVGSLAGAEAVRYSAQAHDAGTGCPMQDASDLGGVAIIGAGTAQVGRIRS